MPPLHIYYSIYIVIWGCLYWMKIVKYNPISWLIIALLVAIIITYLIWDVAPKNMVIKHIIYNLPKLILLCLIDNKNIYDGFIIGTVFFILYLIIIDFNIKYIYYDNCVVKLINSEW